MQVERSSLLESGKRESNALVTYPGLANNSWKRELIRDIDGGSQDIPIESSDGSGKAYVLSACW